MTGIFSMSCSPLKDRWHGFLAFSQLMHAHRLLCIGVSTLVTAASSSLWAADGRDEWKRVNDIFEEMTSPEVRVESREARIARLKSGFAEFDAACLAAMKADPHNPERYAAALFEALSALPRAIIHAPSPANTATSLAGILAAADADAEVQYMADYYDVMTGSDEAEGPGGDPEKWHLRAAAHLKRFPRREMNSMIEARMQSIKSTAELRAKPIEWQFTAVDGRKVDLSKLTGKVVLIDFWATWCGPCLEELPNVLEAYQDLHAKGLEVIGISLDSDLGKMTGFVKEHGMQWPQICDGKEWENELVRKYKIDGIPTMWLVNKQGVLVASDASGAVAMPNSINYLKARIEKLLAE